MRAQIAQAGGGEVFFAGKIDCDGVVAEVFAASRGNAHSVPVNVAEEGECDVLIHNHPGGNLQPSDADLLVAGDAARAAKGFYIIDNDVTCVYAVVEPIRLRAARLLDMEECAAYISSGGALARQSVHFEERPGQIALLKSICMTLNQGAVGVFEAGTGTGKSYAYLIPAMLWAAENRERIVISTGTINLQQQLIEKDIPAAQKIIGKNVRAVLVKGRQNYVCLRRLDDICSEPDLFEDTGGLLRKIQDWAAVSPTGSRTDLSFEPGESLWAQVNSESDGCMGMRCPHREQCFVMKVRREAADASILVVNHHLLFADIESRMEGGGWSDTMVLPPYRRVVFDEAHGIENAASSFFSSTFTKGRVQKQLSLLYRVRRGAVSGNLMVLNALCKEGDFMDEVQAWVERINATAQQVEACALALMETESTLRLYPRTKAQCAGLLECLRAFGTELKGLCGTVRQMIDAVDENDREDKAVFDARVLMRRIDSAATLCLDFTQWEEKSACIFWIQKYRLPQQRNAVPAQKQPVQYGAQFFCTPLDIAPLMSRGVFEPMKSVVCTSATMKSGGSFLYWARRTGAALVEKERMLSGEFQSPFPYDKNMLFAVPADAPFPDSPYFQRYAEDAIARLVLAADGRTLVLFTSHDMLRKSCEYARVNLATSGLAILRQGEEERFRLLERFKSDTSSVLFATDSFWEGVDVPGESLSQVIIVRLPFKVPNDPVWAARCEAVEARGGNSFVELSVPDAVIKFRQGVGRLIRRSSDRGAVVCLDRRVVEKPYGRQFMASIPQSERLYAPLSELLERVESMLSL